VQAGALFLSWGGVNHSRRGSGGTPMKLDELEDKLYDLSPKGRFCLTDEQFSRVFPPGRPDYDAMIRAAKFAHENDCEVRANKKICFVKNNPK
jgi:hypothetical protein